MREPFQSSGSKQYQLRYKLTAYRSDISPEFHRTEIDDHLFYGTTRVKQTRLSAVCLCPQTCLQFLKVWLSVSVPCLHRTKKSLAVSVACLQFGKIAMSVCVTCETESFNKKVITCM